MYMNCCLIIHSYHCDLVSYNMHSGDDYSIEKMLGQSTAYWTVNGVVNVENRKRRKQWNCAICYKPASEQDETLAVT